MSTHSETKTERADDVIRRELTSWIRTRYFRYTDQESAVVLHVIVTGWRAWVAVVGNPDNASYEWVIQRDCEFGDPDEPWFCPDRINHSDFGYGSIAACLRDGLNEAIPD